MVAYWTEHTELLSLSRYLLCSQCLGDLDACVARTVLEICRRCRGTRHPRQHLVATDVDGEFDWLLLGMAGGGERLINWWTWLIVLRRGLSSGPDWPVTPINQRSPLSPHFTLSNAEFSRVATEFSSAVVLQCAVLTYVSSWHVTQTAVTVRFWDSPRRHESRVANCHDHETWALNSCI